MSHRSLPRLTAVTTACAVLSLVGAGAASAQEAPPGSAGKPALDLQAVTCEPEGSALRPTGFCEVPGEVEGTSVNPYTEDGTSPGLLGLRIGGIL